MTHPLAVGILLAKAGCPDEVIAAGILHDTVEDTPVTLDDLQETFGEKVASIVKGASEPDKSLRWEERKTHTIEFLKTASLEVRLVTCADKLHNIRTIAAGQETMGDKVWDRFRRGREKQRWYYLSLVDSLQGLSETDTGRALFLQFKDEVDRLFEEQGDRP
ncbi:MAG: HD domain-containing protein [Pseudomonadota bacterium]